MKQLTVVLILLLALQGPSATLATADRAVAGFTLGQLTKKLEKRFPEVLTGASGMVSPEGLKGDRLPSTNETAYLDTLGPPDGVRSFRYSYAPDAEEERQQNRQWAGMIIRNALPSWRKGKSWVRRALAQAEKNAGASDYSETVEGYRIVVSRAQDRVMVTVSPADAGTEHAVPQALSLARLLNGLAEAFPQRDQGMGNLYDGSDAPSDRFFTDNAHGELETLGSADDLIGLRFVYALRDDHPTATADNRRYALTLVRNVFPDWAAADTWMETTIDKIAAAADPGASHVEIDHGALRLRLRYFVGATAAIEILIHLKDGYL